MGMNAKGDEGSEESAAWIPAGSSSAKAACDHPMTAAACMARQKTARKDTILMWHLYTGRTLYILVHHLCQNIDR